jgi:signal transduction histidine kinase
MPSGVGQKKQSSSKRKEREYLAHTLQRLRWIVPILMSLVGLGYVLLESAFWTHDLVVSRLVREIIVLGAVGPLFTWITLRWAANAAQKSAEAQQQLEQENEDVFIFHAISKAAIHSINLDENLDLVLSRLIRLPCVDAGTIRMRQGNQLEIKAHGGVSAKFVIQEQRLAIGDCLCGQAVQQGEPVRVDDLSSMPAMGCRPCCQEGFLSTLCVPIQANGQVIGLLQIASHAPAAFSERVEILVSMVGHQIGLVAEKILLYNEVRDMKQHLERRVEERTQALMSAQEQLAQKARDLQRQLERTIRVQEDERARIAHEMHDSVMQLIAGLLFQTQAALHSLPVSPVTTEKRLEEVQYLLQRIERETRRAIYDLHPPMLESKGLVVALNQHLERCRQIFGVNCELQVVGTARRIGNTQTELAIFRIVQEAVQNAIQHGGSCSIRASLTFGPRSVQLTVEDDGCGFDVAAADAQDNGGLGLIGMWERARSMGAQLEIVSSPGQGTRVALAVPIQAKEELAV